MLVDSKRRFLGGTLIAFFLLVGIASPGHAHAVLLQREPEANIALAAAPAEVQLRFDEVVTPVLVRVIDASGNPVTGPDSVSEIDTTVHIALPKSLPPGSYVVTYRVISADSHPVGGSYVFAIGSEAADAALSSRLAGGGNSAMWSNVLLLLRAVFYFSFLIAAGGGLFLGLVDRERAALDDRRTITIAAIVAACLIVCSLGVEGTAAADLPLRDLLDASAWRIGITSTLGTSALITVTGLAILVVGVRSRGRWAHAAMIFGAAVGAIGFAATGHVATALPHGVTTPVLVLHVLCAAFWVGALLPLARRLWLLPAATSAPIVARFSRLAVGAVVLLVLAGAAMAIIQVRTPSALFTTDYGWRLVAKLVLVLGLLLLASVNKLWLTPRLVRNENNAAAGLRRSIFLELTLVVGIVVATASLGETPPPRALAEEMPMDNGMTMDMGNMGNAGGSGGSAGYSVATMAEHRTAVVTLTPAHVGSNQVTVTLLNADGTKMVSSEVSVWLSNPALGIEAAQYAAVSNGLGDYATTAPVPVPGTWTVEVDALVSDFERTIFVTDVPIK